MPRDGLHAILRQRRRRRTTSPRPDLALRRVVRVWLDETGVASTLRARTFAVLRSAGSSGLTCNEIAERLGVHPSDLTQRLADLEREGRAYRGVPRRSSVTGLPNVVWHARPPRVRQSLLVGWS